MRAYLFDTETGIYEGETFEEAVMLQYEDGITTLPPPEHGPGQVPVFDQDRELWDLLPISVARQRLNLPATATGENGHDQP